MSLPTTTKPTQLSIRSFFQAQSSNHTPNQTPNGANNQPSPPPPPPAAAAAAAAAQSSTSQAATFKDPTNLNIPREATIRAIQPADITPLRRLNALLLPVSYHDSFYHRAADPVAGRFSRLITWSHHGQEPVVVGGIVCRVEPESPGGKFTANTAAAGPNSQVLYIQSLCLLSPYRSMGLIAAALDTIIDAAIADPDVDIDAVTAHVWTENEEGLHWYEARGFKHDTTTPIKGYYLKLRPDSAWLVSRPVHRGAANVRAALPSSSSTPPLARQGISGTTAAVMNLPPPPPPPPSSSSTERLPPRPPLKKSGQSFQNQRPETEWNDLPDDMTPPLLAPPTTTTRRNGSSEPSAGSSAASSRSSSTARKKKDRTYPVAAFGNS